MKYSLSEFNKCELVYSHAIKKLRGKSVFVVMDVKDEAAYYSLAPLSKAVHELGKEMNVVVKNGRSKNTEVLLDAWKLYDEMERGSRSSAAIALKEFIVAAEKKAGKRFRKIFVRPEILLEAKQSGFEGSANIPYCTKWFRKRRWKDLLATCAGIWKDVYSIKVSERVSIGFELIPKKKFIDRPLEDYLDSYAIARAMLEACNGKCFMGSSSSKESVLEPGERVSELRSTLLGCELSKKSNEEVFAKFRKLSQFLRPSRLEIADAIFAIHGKGSSGKHLFGEAIGYPSLNNKTRWASPGGIIFQPDYAPQTLLDPREPRSRLAFTDTLPVELFIDTCLIDWKALKNRDNKIRGILAGCEAIHVCGKSTHFVAEMKTNSGYRWVRSDDGAVNKKINPEFLAMTGAKAWMMGNLPAGEIFMTPESVTGTITGDVVISVDQSYALSSKNPLVIGAANGTYRIVRGPKNVLAVISKKKREAWTALKQQEKHKSLPKEVIDLKKANFEKIGELGINTNPKARLSRYLIVNEKIANMIHIALGSGFEADRNTEYHYDVVIDAQKQMLDIFGVNGKEKRWLLRKGRFVV